MAQIPIIVADRYRVEREIGVGAMGEVLEARDLTTGRVLALKRLRAQPAGETRAPRDQEQLASLLRHEFLILSQLAHPGVVEVYDLGTDHGLPYYTMELLRGRHPGARDAFDWRQVRRMLLSLCEPLALLHARRLVHRDIAPRNVFMDDDGSAKLIDFGAMASMGGHHRAVGTPTVMAPEVLRRQQLDGRADIYGLGALAYCALTGQHAYPARSLDQLPALWQRQLAAASELVAEVPHAFDQLLLSMLCLEREGRPQSIAELMQRLLAMCDDDAGERGWQAPPAALPEPVLAGRQRQLAEMDGYVTRARGGRGQACLVRGEPGSGRSRLLEAFAQRAENAGFRVVRASAGLLDGAQFSLLNELSQALGAADSETASSPLTAARRRPGTEAESGELQGAFIAFCEQACAQQPLCIAVDDIERADAASTRVLALLVRRASERRFLLALAGGTARAPGTTPLGALLRQAAWIETSPLDAASCESLLRSVFGDVPNVARTARWAHRHSSGHARACMSLLEYLVTTGAAKFVAGSWRLPEDTDSLRLPEHHHEQLALALAGRDAGRELLALLALVTRPFPLELSQYAAVLPDTGARALDELVRAQLVLATNQGYVLRDPGALEELAKTLDDARRRELHARLARAYRQHGEQYAIHVAYHSWQAGDEAAADKLLTQIERSHNYGLRELVWRPGGLGVPPQLFEALLEYRKARGAAPAALFALRSVLVAVTTVSHVELARYAAETLDQLRRDVGLDLWDATDSSSPNAVRLKRCFELAQARSAALPEAERGLPVERAVRELISCVTMLGATSAFTYDAELAREIAEAIAPLRDLNATSRLVAKLTEIAYRSLALGDRILAPRRELIAATAPHAATDIDPITRDGVHHVMLYYLAMDRASEARGEALELAARLEAQPRYEVLGLQVRRIHALACGNFDEAQRLRRRRELSALHTERSDNLLGMAVLREQQLAGMCGDLLELNRINATIEPLARQFPGWQPWLVLGRAQLLVRSDELHAAAELLEAECQRATPFAHDSWHALCATLCYTKLELRDYEAARRIAQTTLEGAAGLGIQMSTELALRADEMVARAGLGDPTSAARELNELIAAHLADVGNDSVHVGVLRESACHVALIAKDYAGFSAQLAALGETYARHPGLRSRHAAWIRKGTQRFRGLIAVLEKANASKDWSAHIANQLSAHSAEDRSEYLLSFVLDELEIDAGQLYRVAQDGKCLLLASRPGGDEPQLMAAVERSLTTWWSAEEVQTADEDSVPTLQDSQGRSYVPLWLIKPAHAEELAGVMLLNCTPEQLGKLTPAFVKAVALHLETIA